VVGIDVKSSTRSNGRRPPPIRSSRRPRRRSGDPGQRIPAITIAVASILELKLA
jgi:hypothetical protein